MTYGFIALILQRNYVAYNASSCLPMEDVNQIRCATASCKTELQELAKTL